MYNKITIDINSTSANLTSFEQDGSASGTNFDKNEKSSTDTCEQHMTNAYRQATNETCLQSVLPDYPVAIQSNTNCSLGNEVFNIAPEESRPPVSIMTGKNCEDYAHPALFAKGQFEFTEDRKIKLSPVKYFNARILHYSRRFATYPEYRFFAQFIMEQKRYLTALI